MKKITSLLLFLLCAISLFSCAKGNESNLEIIAVVKYGTHTSLNEISKTIVDTLNSSTLMSGDHEVKLNELYQIKEYNCEFSSDIMAQIFQNLKRKNVKCVIPIATPTAIAAKRAFSDIPIIFSAVSDPYNSGLVENLDAPEKNITGTSDIIDISKILNAAMDIKEFKTLGYLYTQTEENSVNNLDKIEKYCEDQNLTLEVKSITSINELNEVASSLINKVDALFVTDDNTIASSMARLSQICINAKKPLYCGVESEVRDGGMFCYGINYEELGRETAKIAIKALSGTKISELKVASFDNLKIYINLSYIKKIDLEIPEAYLKNPLTVLIEGEE